MLLKTLEVLNLKERALRKPGSCHTVHGTNLIQAYMFLYYKKGLLFSFDIKYFHENIEHLPQETQWAGIKCMCLLLYRKRKPLQQDIGKWLI